MPDHIEKPAVAPPAWDNIPSDLASAQQWLLWKFETPDKPGKKWRKVPYYVSGGRRTGDQGSERDRHRLCVLEVARRAYAKGGWDGIGFAFLEGDGLVGIDVDGAIDPETGEMSDRCMGIVASCPGTFVELSPSGTGVHVIGLAQTTSAKSNAIGVEMFCGSQFFTVTGRLWAGAPSAIASILPMVIDGLHAMVARAKEESAAASAAAAAGGGRAPQAEAAPSERRASRRREEPHELRARVQDALDALSPALDYDAWIAIGWALRDAFGEDGFDLWDGWSAKGQEQYPGAAKLRAHWRSFTASGKAPEDVVGVIFKRAQLAGWRPASARSRTESARAQRSSPRAETPADDGAGGAGSPPSGPPGGGGEEPPFEDPSGPQSVAEALLRGKGDKPEDCRENVLYCLRHDPELQGLVALNQFTELQDKTRRAPWGTEAGEWTDEDDLMLGEYLARMHRLLVKGTGTLRAGVQMAARENKHHPILERIRGVKWDRVPRLDTWMADCLGAEDRPYLRLVSRFFVMGLVARVLRPGCKFDYMPILHGDQGLGKSSAFRALAAPYFMDTPFRIGDKDSYLSLQGVWLVEFAELESMSKAESTAIKAFVTSPEDRFRPPYGSRMTKVPRRSVLCGTTNADTFLKDATGDRRFWPVHVSEVRADLIEACRDQMFAEALERLQSSDPEVARYYPTRAEERELFVPEQDRWRRGDPWTDYLADYLSRAAEETDVQEVAPCKRGFFTAQELFSRALQIKAERIDNAQLMATRIGNCMKELGFKPDREPRGLRKRGYLRPGWDFHPDTGRPYLVPVADERDLAPQAGATAPDDQEVADAPI
jgi:putative DNA primase/helicase